MARIEAENWYQRGDSNPHPRNEDMDLNHARLPIPPLW